MSWLREGRTGAPDLFVELQDLVDEGFATLDVREVLPCMTEDDLFANEECEGWSEGEGCCPLCGKDIWEHDRGRMSMATLGLERDAMLEALATMLGGIGDVRTLGEGAAFSVETAADDVLVVVAEWSDGARWMRDRTLRGRPFVLVLLDPVVWTGRLGDADWVVTVGMAEVLRDRRVLRDAVKRAVELADLPRDAPAVVELHRLQTRFVHVEHGARVVELREEVVVVDGVEVPISAGMRTVVGYLVDRHLEDVRDGKAPEDFCAFKLGELEEALGEPRTTVRKQLWRFRQRLEERYLEGARRPLLEGAVLEQVDDGWRFSGSCLVRRAS